MTEAERKVRRAALVAHQEWRQDAEGVGRVSDHIVDAVLDALSALSDTDLADVLGRSANGPLGPDSDA